MSLAAPYPGTFLYDQAVENGWLDAANAELVDEHGIQIAPLHYPHLSHAEIFQSVETFYKRFYFRPRKIGDDRQRDGSQSRNDEAPAARRRGVLRIPQGAARRRGLTPAAPPCPAARPRGLIITADDFGMAVSVNEAVESAHRDGVLSAASLMVCAPASVDAVERAKRLADLRVGLHLVLVDGAPVLPASEVPHLVDCNGRFRPDMVTAGATMFFNPAARRELAAEIEAQLQAFQATGLQLDHVNAHKHFQLHPTIAGLILKLGARYGTRAIRVPIEPVATLKAVEAGAAYRPDRLLDAWARLGRARIRRAGMLAPDQVFGLRWSGHMHAGRLEGLIRALPPGLSEIYLHPAIDAGFEGAAPGYGYETELAGLLSPGVARAVSQCGARHGGFADFTR